MKKCSTWNTGADLVISLRYSQNDKELICLGLGRRRNLGSCRIVPRPHFAAQGVETQVLLPNSLPAEMWAFPRECEAARSARDCRSSAIRAGSEHRRHARMLAETCSKDGMTVDGGI